MAEIFARSASEPASTGRVLKSRTYLQESLARKAELKREDDAREAVRLMTGSQDFDLMSRLVPPVMEEIVETPKTVYFYGGSKPRLAVTYNRKTFKTFGKK